MHACGSEFTTWESIPVLSHASSRKLVVSFHTLKWILNGSWPVRVCSFLQLEDYNIPANSILMFQVWAMQRDPLLWERALEFDPSRFLNSDMDVKGMHTGLMPFGAGRRMCPGYNLGLTVLQYTLARLIHSFDWSTTDPQVPLDMTEKFGLTSLRRASVLHAKARPRLPHHLYTT